MIEISERTGIKIVTIEQLAEYINGELKLDKDGISKMPTKFGEFTSYPLVTQVDTEHHVALIMGEPWKDESALVRIHSECLTGDAFSSLRCDCGDQLSFALKEIAENDQDAGLLKVRR